MSLKAAIDAVYDAFSAVEKPRFVDACPCCMTADQCETLTSKPLRELSSDELNEYSGDVMLTVGSEVDYQYFLPRILDLSIADDAEWLNSIEIAAKKMRMAGFDKWDERKQAAIKSLWLEVIRQHATSASDAEMLGWAAWDISSWLAGATLIPIPTSPLLAELNSSPEVIRELYNLNFETLFKGQLKNPFLDQPCEGQAEIAAWLRDRVEKTMN
jgi:hypothetical protein